MSTSNARAQPAEQPLSGARRGRPGVRPGWRVQATPAQVAADHPNARWPRSGHVTSFKRSTDSNFPTRRRQAACVLRLGIVTANALKRHEPFHKIPARRTTWHGVECSPCHPRVLRGIGPRTLPPTGSGPTAGRETCSERAPPPAGLVGSRLRAHKSRESPSETAQRTARPGAPSEASSEGSGRAEGQAKGPGGRRARKWWPGASWRCGPAGRLTAPPGFPSWSGSSPRGGLPDQLRLRRRCCAA